MFTVGEPAENSCAGSLLAISQRKLIKTTKCQDQIVHAQGTQDA